MTDTQYDSGRAGSDATVCVVPTFWVVTGCDLIRPFTNSAIRVAAPATRCEWVTQITKRPSRAIF